SRCAWVEMKNAPCGALQPEGALRRNRGVLIVKSCLAICPHPILKSRPKYILKYMFSRFSGGSFPKKPDKTPQSLLISGDFRVLTPRRGV
ncbi:MAG: hypothetical protein P8O10_00210, partial [Pseudorhodobacter sp.]|nr:hypothetical protein [Pseudorhodobacter sp.]